MNKSEDQLLPADLFMLKRAIHNACEKHPNFVDFFCPYEIEKVRKDLRKQRAENEIRESLKNISFDGVLREEVLEVYEAYLDGDLQKCVKEIDDAIAVLVRAKRFARLHLAGEMFAKNKLAKAKK